MAGYLAGTPGERWLVADDGAVVGLAFVVAEQMTEGTFNLLAMAGRQGQGIGRAILAYGKATLAAEAAGVLLVVTSGLPDYAPTQAFI